MKLPVEYYINKEARDGNCVITAIDYSQYSEKVKFCVIIYQYMIMANNLKACMEVVEEHIIKIV